LHGMGFHGRAAASQPYITKCNAKRRMQWCKARRHWTLEHDESRFSIWQSDGRVWVSLVPVKGTLNASAYQNVLDNSMLPTLWEQFGAGPFIFQHDCAPVHKARSIKTWMTESGVDELDWPCT
ncbi:hypothetical protein M9458_014705, partial [Cirrhinus mrigala]